MKSARRLIAARPVSLSGLAVMLALSSMTCGAANESKEDSVRAGADLFTQNCSFCHGKDARGGEVGPDLTGSPLVQTGTDGDKIASVLREGRFGTAMPSFNLTSTEVDGIVAFLHERAASVAVQEGDRGNVKNADLQTGDAIAGEKYFRSTGTCTNCHSAAGDLAGVAKRYQGLQLLQRMLNPQHPTRRVTVTTNAGKTTRGTLQYLDEFTIGLRDQEGTYHSWRASDVTYQMDMPITAHSDLLARYSDEAMHNLFAYLETLK